MQEIEKMSVKALYRGILKGLKTYPSRNRIELREAVKLDFRDGKKLTKEIEISKAVRKARMGFAHVLMYEEKLKEIMGTGCHIDKPVKVKSFALAKGDPEFVYF